MPELYDFLCELLYKALFFEDFGERRVFVDKLENVIKLVWKYVFQRDKDGVSKFAFALDWGVTKADLKSND